MAKKARSTDSDFKFTDPSTLHCPDCKQDIRVGTAGSNNLSIHHGSKGCRAARERKSRALRKPKEKPDAQLNTFFRPKAAVNPSTVSAPLPIHAPAVLPAPLTEVNAESHPSSSTILSLAPDIISGGLEGNNVCPVAVKLLHELQVGTERIPAHKPEAGLNHRLSAFSVDPSSCIGQANDDWEDILNPMMKGAFGWGEDAMCGAAKEMLCRGQFGLDGFIRFLRFFVMNRGLKGAMVESKVTALLEEMEIQYPLGPSRSSVPEVPEVIDMDSFDELLEGDAEIELVGSAAACKGVLVIAFCTYRPPDGRYIFQENITRDLNIPH